MDINYKDKIFITLYNQWPAIFNPKKYNWIDFTFFNFQIEIAPYKHANELSFGIFGLIIIITINKG